MDFKRKVRKLKHLVVQSIYYQLLNTSSIFMYNAWTYCKCDEFQGCRLTPRNRLENGDRSYCFICRVRVEYHADRIENLKKIADIINNVLKIKTDIQLCVDFDPSCNNFWMYHYKTSWIDHFGECRWKYLKKYIDTYNICFIDK